MEKVNLVNVCEFFECEIPVIEMVSISVLNFTYSPLMRMNFSPFKNVYVLDSSGNIMMNVLLRCFISSMIDLKRAFSSRSILSERQHVTFFSWRICSFEKDYTRILLMLCYILFLSMKFDET